MGSARFEHMGYQIILQLQPIRSFHLDRVSPALGTLLGQPLVRNGDSHLGLALEPPILSSFSQAVTPVRHLSNTYGMLTMGQASRWALERQRRARQSWGRGAFARGQSPMPWRGDNSECPKTLRGFDGRENIGCARCTDGCRHTGQSYLSGQEGLPRVPFLGPGDCLEHVVRWAGKNYLLQVVHTHGTK